MQQAVSKVRKSSFRFSSLILTGLIIESGTLIVRPSRKSRSSLPFRALLPDLIIPTKPSCHSFCLDHTHFLSLPLPLLSSTHALLALYSQISRPSIGHGHSQFDSGRKNSWMNAQGQKQKTGHGDSMPDNNTTKRDDLDRLILQLVTSLEPEKNKQA